MVCSSSFAAERRWFVVCLELVFKNSQILILHRVLPSSSPQLHLPRAQRQSSRGPVPIFFSDPTPIPGCQSPPSAPLPDTNSLPIALAKLQPKSHDRPKQLPPTGSPPSETTALAEQGLGRVREGRRRGGLENPRRMDQI